jgi:hypothetical protein
MSERPAAVFGLGWVHPAISAPIIPTMKTTRLGRRSLIFAPFFMAEAVDHGFDQRLFETTRRIRMGYDFRRIFCQIACSR